MQILKITTKTPDEVITGELVFENKGINDAPALSFETKRGPFICEGKYIRKEGRKYIFQVIE